jgi:hypothetical protein
VTQPLFYQVAVVPSKNTSTSVDPSLTLSPENKNTCKG